MQPARLLTLGFSHLVFPVFLENFYAFVGLGDIRLEDDEGFPPTSGVPPCSPQGVPCLKGLGGMGPSYQGPRHLGVAPSLKGC